MTIESRRPPRAIAVALLSTALLALPALGARAAADPPLTTAAGTWVYRHQSFNPTAYTVETLHLRQARNGSVSGNGSAVVTAPEGIGHAAINVTAGLLTKHKLTLTLYATRTDAGSGPALTAVEYLHCTGTAHKLHCLMSVPLLRVSNAPLDFKRA